MTQRTFRNPILPGFNPDPSICRVGDDYYLVTSSFVYFPGLPVYHSKDLVHWHQLGYALDRPSQLNLDGAGSASGLWAPTIRHHEGLFYIINTNTAHGGNYIVTATDPAGPWSEPIWIAGANGIDPSLLFDDDGRIWYTGNYYPSNGAWPCQATIWLQELDPNSFQLIGSRHDLWSGALIGATDAEAPHLYKINGMYYLMVAEGGTFENHAVTIARSNSITAPYIGNPSNPILTHRHLGKDHPVACVGHADMVQTQDGDWWMVALAVRFYGGGRHSNLGRETFLAPVKWEDSWPVVAPGIGQLSDEGPAPDLHQTRWPRRAPRDNFDSDSLDMNWNFIRTPREAWWSLSERPGWFRMKLRPEVIQDKANPSAIVRRQQHMSFIAETHLEFAPQAEGESAGMVVFFMRSHHFRFLVTGSCTGKTVIQVMRCNEGVEELVAEHPLDSTSIGLRVRAVGQDYSFLYAAKPGDWKPLAENLDGRILSSFRPWGFTGTMLGLYATSHGKPSTTIADFDWFDYSH